MQNAGDFLDGPDEGALVHLSAPALGVTCAEAAEHSEGVGLGESPDLVAPLLDAEPGGGNLLLRARDIREQAESLQKLDVFAAVERLCPGCGCDEMSQRDVLFVSDLRVTLYEAKALMEQM